MLITTSPPYEVCAQEITPDLESGHQHTPKNPKVRRWQKAGFFFFDDGSLAPLSPLLELLSPLPKFQIGQRMTKLVEFFHPWPFFLSAMNINEF
jgi:hypothetical protein